MKRHYRIPSKMLFLMGLGFCGMLYFFPGCVQEKKCRPGMHIGGDEDDAQIDTDADQEDNFESDAFFYDSDLVVEDSDHYDQDSDSDSDFSDGDSSSQDGDPDSHEDGDAEDGDAEMDLIPCEGDKGCDYIGQINCTSDTTYRECYVGPQGCLQWDCST